MAISEVSVGATGIDVSIDENFGLVPEGNINARNEFTTAAMKNVETHKIMRVVTSSSRRSSSINHEMVQAIWVIYPALTKNTVECTKQRGVRISCPHPSLTNQIQTNDRMLRYNRFTSNVLADTLISGTVSKRGNKHAEVFATDFGWARAYPMKNKSDAHKALSLIFQRTRVSDKMIVDGSKEHVLGKPQKKCLEIGCQLKQTEPSSPWQNDG